MLKFRCQTSIGYKTRKCTQAVEGGLLGVTRALQSNINNTLFPPACSSPLITETLPGSWPGRYMRMDWTAPNSTVCTVCTVPKSVRYHISFRLHVCYQPGQAKWHVRSLSRVTLKAYIHYLKTLLENASFSP
jgi:hypothetical protein